MSGGLGPRNTFTSPATCDQNQDQHGECRKHGNGDWIEDREDRIEGHSAYGIFGLRLIEMFTSLPQLPERRSTLTSSLVSVS